MFIVYLKYVDNHSQGQALMGKHESWVQQGVEDGVFITAGPIRANLGGGILAHNTTRESLQARVDENPLVREQLVIPRILSIAAGQPGSLLAA